LIWTKLCLVILQNVIHVFNLALQIHQVMSTTKKTCHSSGHLLGNNSLPIITVIDTPGFGNNLIEEEKTINNMVTYLRDDIKFVHVFIIAFKQQVLQIFLIHLLSRHTLTWRSLTRQSFVPVNRTLVIRTNGCFVRITWSPDNEDWQVNM